MALEGASREPHPQLEYQLNTGRAPPHHADGGALEEHVGWIGFAGM
jgi:hypothetical protein